MKKTLLILALLFSFVTVHAQTQTGSSSVQTATTGRRGTTQLATQSDVDAADTTKAVTPELLKFNRAGIPAAAQTGATDALKMAAGQTAAAAAGVPLVIDNNLGSTTTTPSSLYAGLLHIDTRGGTGYTYEGAASTTYKKGVNYLLRDTTSYGAAVANPAIFRWFYNPQDGGYSTSGGPKTNYQGTSLDMLVQTVGQSIGHNIAFFKSSLGDAQGFSAAMFTSGAKRDGGDEGVVAFRGAVYQVANTFKATITSISGNTLSYNTIFYPGDRGQDRYLINTTTGVYSTGTVSSISGANPTVTGSGTNWTSLGSGAVSNLYFAMDSDTSTYGQKHVVKIATINSATSITLDYTVAGAAQAWPSGAATSGAYKIYKGSDIAHVYDSTLGVVDGTQFAIGDVVESPAHRGANGAGINLTLIQKIPSPLGFVGIDINNTSSIAANYLIGASGSYSRLVSVNGNITGNILHLSGTVGGAVIFNEQSSLIISQNLNNAGSGYNSIAYDKATDSYNFKSGVTTGFGVKTGGYFGVNVAATTGTRGLIAAGSGDVTLELRQTVASSNFLRMTNTNSSRQLDMELDTGGNMVWKNNAGGFYYDAFTGHNYRINGTDYLKLDTANLRPTTAAGITLGSASIPFKYLYLAGDSGTPASNNFKLTGTATGARTKTLGDATDTLVGTLTGTAAPAVTPNYNGQLFVDTTGKKLYVATGTSSSADWTILN